MGTCLSCLKDRKQHSQQQQQQSHISSPSATLQHRPSLAAVYHKTLGQSDSEGSNCTVLGITRASAGAGACSSSVIEYYISPPSGAVATSASSGRRFTTVTVEPCGNGTTNISSSAGSKLSIMGVTGGSGSGGGGSSSGNSGSEKRSFYSRIPPLTRSASHESRRHSSKEYYSETKINTLFDIYREPSHVQDGGSSAEDVEDVMLSDGIQRFCVDLDVNPDDLRVLLFAWKCEAETMCRFTRSEFVRGCKSIRADSVKSIVNKFSEMQSEALDFDKFKNMYKWAFKFGLDSEVGQRILPSDMAILLWKLVFEQRKPKILERWLAFLESHPSIRGIPRDTWNMFLNFSETVGDDLSSYDDTEAWPSLFDDFVEYENDQLNQNISKEPKQ